MATNFPTTLDTNATLGGLFANAALVVDPITNIDAQWRNNGNDAMFAVQAKLGVADSLVPTSVDWGLLGVGGTPNQGLRFSAANAAWPGLVGEDGIFLNVATGVPAFHFAGDAVPVHYDVITELTYGLQSAYDYIPTIVTSGGADLSVSGTENVSFTFGVNTKQMMVVSPAYLGTGTPAVDGLVFVSMTPSANSLSAVQARTVHGVTKTTCSAIFAVNETTLPIAGGSYYGVVAQNVCAEVNAGTAYGYDFIADTPSVGPGAGTFQSYGFYSKTAHSYGHYSAGATASGFFSNSDEYGFRALAATQAAFYADAGSDTNIRLHAATTYDIFSDQTKVTFEFADAAADVFLLDADGLDATTGRTSHDGMFYVKCPIGHNGTAARIDLWNCISGNGNGGNSVYTVVRSGDDVTYKALTNTGVMTAFFADHITYAEDNVAGVHQAIKANFSFENSVVPGGLYDIGPEAYGLRVSMPESERPVGTYNTNDGYATPRWAIKIDAGECNLRRTLMEGPNNLGKSVLHIHQTDEDKAFINYDGSSSAADNSLNMTTSAVQGLLAVVGPMANVWEFKGMIKINITDDNTLIPDGDYWMPIYSYSAP